MVLTKYYEIIARNDGRASATHLKLSMFFFSNIIKNASVIYSENATFKTVLKHELKKQVEPSLLTASLPRLAKGGIVITYVWTDSDENSPFYISTTYDQGSRDYISPNLLLPSSTNTGPPIAYPVLQSGQYDIPINDKIIIIALILTVVFFAIALGSKRIKHFMIRRNLSKFPSELELEITTAQDIIGKNIESRQIISSEIWDSAYNEVKREIFADPTDYDLIAAFYKKLESRNMTVSQVSNDLETVKKSNQDCFHLASSALDVRWQKYYSAVNGSRKVDVFLALPFSIPSNFAPIF